MEADTFPTRLRRARKLAGFTQEDLAIEAGVSESYISRLEGGYILSPGGPRLQRIADALSVTTAYLLTGREGENLESRDRLYLNLRKVSPHRRASTIRTIQAVVEAAEREDQAGE